MLCLVFGLLAVLTCAPGGGASGEYRWQEHVLANPGKLHGVLECGGKTATVEVHYPSWRVVLCDPDMNWTEGVSYERVYDTGPLYEDRGYRIRGDLSQEGSPVQADSFVDPGVTQLDGRRSLFHGYYRGQVLYALESADLSGKDLARLAESVLANEDTLGTGILPRMEAQQWIEGRWERLTQFNIGCFHYRPAPEDTVRLRFRFAALRATFFKDRVELRPIDRRQLRGWRFSMRLAGEPASPAIMPLFEMQGVEADSFLVVEFPRWSMYPTTDFAGYVDGNGIHNAWRPWAGVVGRPDLLEGMKCLASIVPPTGPNAFPGDPEGANFRQTFAHWPLWVTVHDLRLGKRAERGFPGEIGVPDWAMQRLRAWGIVQDGKAR
jgi:hypothetical protein